MNNKLKIDPFDEALRAVYFESALDASNSASAFHLKNILSTNYSHQISQANRQSILRKLNDSASSLSFGNLLDEAMQTKKFSVNDLASEAKVSVAIIDDLRTDKIFPNNVPVVFLKNILQALHLSFSKVESSIIKTFELLKGQTVIEAINFRDLQPSFRKGFHASRESSSWHNSMAESRDLFENEEALRKYLTRLGELMRGDG